jgi:hypothetical protein
MEAAEPADVTVFGVPVRPATGWRLQVRPAGFSQADAAVTLMDAAVIGFAFEQAEAIRKFGAWRRMRNWHTRFVSLKTGRQFSLESRGEHRLALVFEASSRVQAWSAQPFRFHYRLKGEKRVRSGVPDFGVRMVDKALVVVDHSFDPDGDKGLRRARQAALALCCSQYGLGYSVMPPPPIEMEATLWAGYAAARFPEVAPDLGPVRALRRMFTSGELAERTMPPTAADLRHEDWAA